MRTSVHPGVSAAIGESSCGKSSSLQRNFSRGAYPWPSGVRTAVDRTDAAASPVIRGADVRGRRDRHRLGAARFSPAHVRRCSPAAPYNLAPCADSAPNASPQPGSPCWRFCWPRLCHRCHMPWRPATLRRGWRCVRQKARRGCCPMRTRRQRDLARHTCWNTARIARSMRRCWRCPRRSNGQPSSRAPQTGSSLWFGLTRGRTRRG
jgi:hypothetical protein